ncbi:MAG: hypothetical protein ACK4RS_01390 [Thiothrix sp.]
MAIDTATETAVLKERVDRHRDEIQSLKSAVQEIASDVRKMNKELSDAIEKTNDVIQKFSWIAAGVLIGLAAVQSGLADKLVKFLIG